MHTLLLRGSAVVMAMAVVSVVRPALGDTKAECAKAYESSQEQKSGGKLLAARESLVTCSQSGCPSFIKKDCAKWLSEVEGAIPTVVFSAKAKGADLTDVKVTLGDQTLAEALDGKAIPIDPGTHTFVFESAKHGSKELKFVVKEGQKAQNIEVVFGGADDGGEGGGAAAGGGDGGSHDGGSTSLSADDVKGSKTLGYVLAGVGVVGIGGFAYFALSGKSDEKNLACADKKTCSDSDIDPIKKKYLFADISLGVGVVSLGVATYLLVTSGGKKEAPAEAKAFRFDVAPTRGGGYASVLGQF